MQLTCRGRREMGRQACIAMKSRLVMRCCGCVWRVEVRDDPNAWSCMMITGQRWTASPAHLIRYSIYLDEAHDHPRLRNSSFPSNCCDARVR
jgi:hypothetical protein